MAKSGPIDKAVDAAMDEIKRRVSSIVNDIGYDLAEAIQINYDKAIDLFYNDYEPWYYDRTYSTYMASDGENGVSNLFNIKSTDAGFEITAGITVDSSRLGQPYKDPADYVFKRTWQWGIHGAMFTGGFMMGRSGTPKMAMDRWFKQFKESEYGLIVNKHLKSVKLIGSRK